MYVILLYVSFPSSFDGSLNGSSLRIKNANDADEIRNLSDQEAREALLARGGVLTLDDSDHGIVNGVSSSTGVALPKLPQQPVPMAAAMAALAASAAAASAEAASSTNNTNSNANSASPSSEVDAASSAAAANAAAANSNSNSKEDGGGGKGSKNSSNHTCTFSTFFLFPLSLLLSNLLL